MDSAYDVGALLDQLGHDKAVVGGGDQGGEAAMEFSNHFPESTIRLIVWKRPMPDIPEAYAAAAINSSQAAEVLAVSTHIEDYGLRPDAFVASLPEADTPHEEVCRTVLLTDLRVGRRGLELRYAGHHSVGQRRRSDRADRNRHILKTLIAALRGNDNITSADI